MYPHVAGVRVKTKKELLVQGNHPQKGLAGKEGESQWEVVEKGGDAPKKKSVGRKKSRKGGNLKVADQYQVQDRKNGRSKKRKG